VESGKDDKNRPQLQEALRECRLTGAKLIVSRLDRLSRDVEFIAHLQKISVKFVVADMPHANNMTVQLLAVLAQHERELAKQRTQDALATAKAKTKKRGAPEIGRENFRTHGDRGRQLAVASLKRKADAFAQDLAPILQRYVTQGHTQEQMAKALNRRGIRTPRGNVGKWTQGRVSRVLARLKSGTNPTG
jgi:DNA invertase Pin-like site-specific DNA recombinase